MSSSAVLAVSAAYKNWALGRPAWQSSLWGHHSSDPSLAVDGNRDADLHHGSCAHTSPDDRNPWWAVDLGDEIAVRDVYLTNRGDCCG